MSKLNYSKKFSADEVAAFCEQIALILNGGIPLYEGTYMICSEVEDAKTKEILTKVDEMVKQNMPFYQALEETKAFPAYMVNMVRIGEITGKLEEVMQSLSRYYDRESRVKDSIRSVIAYPLLLFSIMAVILLILVIKILPMFEQVFDELSAESALSSGDMISFGMLAGKIIAIITVCLFLLLFVLLLWYRTDSGKRSFHAFLRMFLPTKGITEQLALGKMVSSMSLMISSGIDSKEALTMAETVVGHPKVSQKLISCVELLLKGSSLDEALKETKLITGIQGRMLRVGAKTGVMDLVFQRLSKQYDEEIESRLHNISSIVETILVVLLSCIVGAILISVMLPLISIISSIG